MASGKRGGKSLDPGTTHRNLGSRRSNSRNSWQKIPNFAIFHFPAILECWPERLAFLSGTNMSTETNISVLHGDPRTGTAERSTFKVLLAISICTLLNDTAQSLLPALYPFLRNTLRLA